MKTHAKRSEHAVATVVARMAGYLGWLLAGSLLVAANANAQSYSEQLHYDERGNLIQRTLLDRVIGYRYDGLDRLQEETAPGNQRLVLDADGNRLSDGRSIYNVAPGGQRLAMRDGVALPHGPAGHLLADRTWRGGRWVQRQFDWTLDGQISAVRLDGMAVAAYHYNEARQRTRKTLAVPPAGVPAITLYRYDPAGQLTLEVAGSAAQSPGVSVTPGQVLVRYIWQDAVPVAVVWPPMTPGNPNASTERIVYLHTDQLNTPRRASDARGVLVWQWISDAYGSSPPDEDPDQDGRPTTIHLRFPGQYYDAESGLHYNWNRYYDPQVGRYTQTDPIGLQGGVNTYAYAESQPTALTDPLGLATYMCMKPLERLGGQGLRSGPDVVGNPLYHQYLCIPDASGQLRCGGHDTAGGAYAEGKPSNDQFKAERCSQVQADNNCVETCILSAINNPQRPPYWLFGGGTLRMGGEVPALPMNCQQWATYQFRRCVALCGKP